MRVREISDDEGNRLKRIVHREQGSMIRRYIAWRNRHTADSRLHRIVKRANVA